MVSANNLNSNPEYNNKILELESDYIKLNKLKDKLGSILFVNLFFWAFLFLFFGFIIGAIVGLILKSWLVFWMIFVGPTALLILEKKTIPYQINNLEQKINISKSQIENTRLENIENEYKEHNIKYSKELEQLRLEAKLAGKAELKKYEEKIKATERKQFSRMDLIYKFKISADYKLIQNFVKKNEIDINLLVYNFREYDEERKCDNYNILKILCSKEHIIFKCENIPETANALSELQKNGLSEIDIANYTIYYPFNFDDDGLFENILDLQELLKNKGADFNVAEIVYLIILECQNQEFLDLERKMSSKILKTKADYINSFLDLFFDYNASDLFIFNKLLINNNIKLDSKDLLFEIEKIKKERKLKYLESKIMKDADESITIKDIDSMSGYDFEKFLLKLYKRMGYSVIQHTQLSNDQGADLVVKNNGVKYVVQAKRYSGVVGNSAIQQVVASIRHYGAEEGVVVTNSTFTTSAIALAKSNKIELIDRRKLSEIIDKYL